MRTPATVGMTGLTGLILLLSWHSSLQAAPITQRTVAAAAGVVDPSPSVPASAPPAGPAPVRRTAAPAVQPLKVPVVHDTVVNGSPVDTRYGPVQLQVTLRSGRIIKADAIDYPQGSDRDQQINSYAVPQLDDETVQAQSAQIDTVSGATYTSDGYRQSLQSALDAAHRAGAL